MADIVVTKALMDLLIEAIDNMQLTDLAASRFIKRYHADRISDSDLLNLIRTHRQKG